MLVAGKAFFPISVNMDQLHVLHTYPSAFKEAYILQYWPDIVRGLHTDYNDLGDIPAVGGSGVVRHYY